MAMMTTQNSSEASMVLDWIVETPATTSVDMTQRFTNSARTTKITWAPLPYLACMICERNTYGKITWAPLPYRACMICERNTYGKSTWAPLPYRACMICERNTYGNITWAPLPYLACMICERNTYSG